MDFSVRDKTIGSGILLAMLSVSVHAVEPSRIGVGDYELEATMNAKVEMDDNVARSKTTEVDSAVLNVAPKLVLINDTTARKVRLSYSAEYVDYLDIDVESYLSHTLDGSGKFQLSRRHYVKGTAAYQLGHEALGTGSTEGLSASTVSETTEYSDAKFGLEYGFGSPDKGAQLILGAKHSDREFKNFEILTSGRDNTAVTLSAKLKYKYSQASSVFVDLSQIDRDYDQTLTSLSGQLDGKETTTRVGVQWSATKKTTGTISVGSTNKKIDALGTDVTNSSWAAQVRWSPNQVNNVVVDTSRAPGESTGFGAFQDVERWGLSWQRQITPSLSSNLFSSLTSTSFESQNREDDVVIYGGDLRYSFTPRLDMSFRIQLEEKDSNLDQFDYDRGVYNLGVSLAL